MEGGHGNVFLCWRWGVANLKTNITERKLENPKLLTVFFGKPGSNSLVLRWPGGGSNSNKELVWMGRFVKFVVFQCAHFVLHSAAQNMTPLPSKRRYIHKPREYQRKSKRQCSPRLLNQSKPNTVLQYKYIYIYKQTFFGGLK